MKKTYRFFTTLAAAAAIMTAAACSGGNTGSITTSATEAQAVTTAAPETTTTTAAATTTESGTAAAPETSKTGPTSMMPVVIPDETDAIGTEVAISGSGEPGDITEVLPVEIPGGEEGSADVDVFSSGGAMLAAAVTDGEEPDVPAQQDGYGYKVFIFSVEPGTPKDKVSGLCSDLGLTVVYDYENFDMYAVSADEPLAEDAAEQLMEKIENYEFILMVEPDSAVSLAGAEVQ